VADWPGCPRSCIPRQLVLARAPRWQPNRSNARAWYFARKPAQRARQTYRQASGASGKKDRSSSLHGHRNKMNSLRRNTILKPTSRLSIRVTIRTIRRKGPAISTDAQEGSIHPERGRSPRSGTGRTISCQRGGNIAERGLPSSGCVVFQENCWK